MKKCNEVVHINNASAQLETLITCSFYKNMCKRIPFVSTVLLVYLIRGGVTERSYVIHLQLIRKEVHNLKRQYLSSGDATHLLVISHIVSFRNEPREI